MTPKSFAEQNNDYALKVNEASQSLEEKLGWKTLKNKPKTAIVLGSGLGKFVSSLQETKIATYSSIKHMPQTAIVGHEGQWVLGLTKNKIPVLVAQGRFHFYEGHSFENVTLPIRMMSHLGLEHLILTNAAGSVNTEFEPGDFMIIKDHLNLTGHSPLTGIFHEDFGPRFVDMSFPYEKKINEALLNRAFKSRPDIKLHHGVYACLMGPQYETPAEIRMLGKLGADAVGMSTVPECIVAKQAGMKVNGISCITNFGSGLADGDISHGDVAETAQNSTPDFCYLLNEMITLIHQEESS